MQWRIKTFVSNVHSDPEGNGGWEQHTCQCAFPFYANVPVSDERGRYCSACGHYERAPKLVAVEEVLVAT